MNEKNFWRTLHIDFDFNADIMFHATRSNRSPAIHTYSTAVDRGCLPH